MRVFAHILIVTTAAVFAVACRDNQQQAQQPQNGAYYGQPQPQQYPPQPQPQPYTQPQQPAPQQTVAPAATTAPNFMGIPIPAGMPTGMPSGLPFPMPMPQ
jgi:hypothetical protein